MSKSARNPVDTSGASAAGHALRGAAAPDVAMQPPRSTRGATKADKATKERAWNEVASFVIHFERRSAASGGGSERRITAHKMQDGGITARWTGLAQQPMVGWIAEHLSDWGDLPGDEPVSHAAEATPGVAGGTTADVPAPLPDASQVSLSVAGVAARQAGASGAPAARPEAPSAASIRLRSHEAFVLDATIEIAAVNESLVDPLGEGCTVQFFGRNILTQEGIRLGQAKVDAAPVDREGGRRAFRASLDDVSLPAGTYRLVSVATLSTRPAKLAHFQGPMLEVL